MAAFVPSAQQQRIIGAPQDDDVLVVAGAGSGKTFTPTPPTVPRNAMNCRHASCGTPAGASSGRSSVKSLPTAVT